MPTTTNTSETPEAAAVAEATRIATEAARRSTEAAQASIEVARTWFDEASDLNQDLFKTWSGQGDAVIKTAFEAQNAAFEAALGFYDLGIKTGRQGLLQLTDLMRRTQQYTLEGWQSTVKTATKAAALPKR